MNESKMLQDNVQIPETVLVPRGSITLRDDRTNRCWTTEIKAFHIGRYPVTAMEYELRGSFDGQSDAELPKTNVSWLQAIRFCNHLSERLGLGQSYRIWPDESGADLIQGLDGYRLLTEAEWEYACRAGTSAPRYGELEEIAWYRHNSGGGPRPVGLRKPNAWGLHDMLGNVWEWCHDQYDPEIYGCFRSFRGGGWADDPRGCLATNRRRSHPTFSIDDLGFRLARSHLKQGGEVVSAASS